jgi:hypothetical protein
MSSGHSILLLFDTLPIFYGRKDKRAIEEKTTSFDEVD